MEQQGSRMIGGSESKRTYPRGGLPPVGNCEDIVKTEGCIEVGVADRIAAAMTSCEEL